MLVLAFATATIVHGALARAAEAEAEWRSTRTVLVANRAIEVGEPLAGAVEPRRLPVVAVPTGALTTVPTGRVAVATIGRGEVVIAMRVSGERSAGVAALLPPGTRALVIPLPVAGLPVRPGDRVDLLTSGTDGLPVATGSAAPVQPPVARSALVVSATAKSLVVAVGATDAARVAAALGQGPLVTALAAPG